MNSHGQVKLIDFANEKRLQTVVDKEIDQYLGHVSTVRIPGTSTIYCVYVKGHGRGQAVLKKSVDNGQTWSARLSIPNSWSTLLQIPTLFCFNSAENSNRISMITGHYPLRISHSDNKGESWSELEQIGNFGGNVSMSSVIHTNNLCYMAFFHDDGRFLNGLRRDIRYQLYKNSQSGSYDVILAKSNRITEHEWSENKCDIRTTKGEIEVDQLDLIYESYCGRREEGDISRIYKTQTEDGGLTWSEPEAIVYHEKVILLKLVLYIHQIIVNY